MTMAATLYGPGQDRQDRFQLNDMSFAGPVIMGIGGKYYKRSSTSKVSYRR